jgi:cyclopropane-fatty-acyl-phospholipid synthase
LAGAGAGNVSEALRGIPAAPGAGARLAERLVLGVLERIEGGAIELRLPDGTVHRFGAGRPAAVQVANRDLFRRLLWHPRLGLGDSYVAGDWRADDLPWLFELLIRAVERWREGSHLPRLERLRPHVAPRQSLRRARRNIGYHYDLGNDLYRLFLDESLTYSCAIWKEEDTLERAQERKLRRVCERLGLGPEDHVLEIGCGWGSFALCAAGRYGARVTGLTISEQQASLARERVAAAGLDDRIEIRLQDYRTLDGQYTKIASIEMLEAIGHAQFPVFFEACDRLLAPGGCACVQTIVIPDERYERYRRHDDWIRRYIFPGSLLPSVEALRRAMGRASALRISGLEDIGPHYAPTLQAWRDRFLARLQDVRRLGYDERFLRTWDFYLAYCEAAFRTHSLRDVQLVLKRALA